MSETQAVSETCFTRSNRQTRKQHQTDKQTDRHLALLITRISLLKFMPSECKCTRRLATHTHTHTQRHTHTDTHTHTQRHTHTIANACSPAYPTLATYASSAPLSMP